MSRILHELVPAVRRCHVMFTLSEMFKTKAIFMCTSPPQISAQDFGSIVGTRISEQNLEQNFSAQCVFERTDIECHSFIEEKDNHLTARSANCTGGEQVPLKGCLTTSQGIVNY